MEFENSAEMYQKAVEIAVTEESVSTSLLERKMGIGYGRAAAIIDQMENEGIVGPYNGKHLHQVLMTLEQYKERFENAPKNRKKKQKMELTKLKAYFQKLPQLGFPSAQIAVAKDGKVIYSDVVGHADFEGKVPAKKDSLSWVWSTSKVICCVATMRLVERGLLKLDEPVSKYLPSFEHMFIKGSDGSIREAQNPITVEHLFTMTAGFDYDFNAPAIRKIRENPHATSVEVADAIAQGFIGFEPGTHFRYSLCHDILPAIVCKITGKSFYEYLKEEILIPLGINERNFGYHPDQEQIDRFVCTYRFRNGMYEAIPAPDKNKQNEYSFSDQYESGGAGVFCCADEYIKIIAAVANNGTAENGYQVLKPETVQMLTENRLCPDALDDFAYGNHFGYGWGLCGRTHLGNLFSNGLSPKGEFGWDGAACQYALLDSKNHLALYFNPEIHHCNIGFNVVHRRLRDSLYLDLGLGEED